MKQSQVTVVVVMALITISFCFGKDLIEIIKENDADKNNYKYLPFVLYKERVYDLKTKKYTSQEFYDGYVTPYAAFRTDNFILKNFLVITTSKLVPKYMESVFYRNLADVYPKKIDDPSAFKTARLLAYDSFEQVEIDEVNSQIRFVYDETPLIMQFIMYEDKVSSFLQNIFQSNEKQVEIEIAKEENKVSFKAAVQKFTEDFKYATQCSKIFSDRLTDYAIKEVHDYIKANATGTYAVLDKKPRRDISKILIFNYFSEKYG